VFITFGEKTSCEFYPRTSAERSRITADSLDDVHTLCSQRADFRLLFLRNSLEMREWSG